MSSTSNTAIRTISPESPISIPFWMNLGLLVTGGLIAVYLAKDIPSVSNIAAISKTIGKA